MLHLSVIWKSGFLAEFNCVFHNLVQIIVHYITVLYLHDIIGAVLLVKPQRKRAILVLVAK